MNKINIAIDGYSSCGKSTLAKQLASELAYIYVDTGAMYRAITWFLLENNICQADKEIDIDAVVRALPNIRLSFVHDSKHDISRVILNGSHVEKQIRGMRVSSAVSRISVIRQVRRKLLEIQREIAARQGVVMEGRDIGSVVLPHAQLKLFLKADLEVRVERRYLQLRKKGMQVLKKTVRENILNRDHADTSRQENPLLIPDDAIVIDNTHMTQQQQLDMALEFAKMRISSGRQ